jgi:integrase
MGITDREIKNYKPDGKDKFYSDGDGLYLRVAVSGSKTFMYRSKHRGKTKWVALGSYPTLSLKQARDAAQALRDAAALKTVTVNECYKDWIKHIKREYKSPKQVEQRLDLHLIPTFGARTLVSITRAEIATHLKSIAATAPVQANRVLTDTKLLFNYAIDSGWLENSPAERIRPKAIGGKEKSRNRVLTDDELVELISILRNNWSIARQKTTGFDEKTRLALALALLTGQRSQEIRSINTKHITWRTWTQPVEVTKTDTEMKVYLNYGITLILNYAFKHYGSTPFKGMAGQTLSHATRYMKFANGFTPHDLRRTMRTRMADLGVMPHIGEKCLNHKLTGVLAVYDRGEYAQEKKAAWYAWTRYLISLIKKAPRLGGLETVPVALQGGTYAGEL